MERIRRYTAYNIETWLIHPDWKSSAVNITRLIDTQRLTIFLLHPLDLIITKLSRGSGQDVEDGILLRARYIDDVNIARQRTLEATDYFALFNQRNRNIIQDSFDAIFDDPIVFPDDQF